jgi:hypothetical protein
MNTETSSYEKRLRTTLQESAHALSGEPLGARVEGPYTLSKTHAGVTAQQINQDE